MSETIASGGPLFLEPAHLVDVDQADRGVKKASASPHLGVADGAGDHSIQTVRSTELDLEVAAFLADLADLRIQAGAPTYATLARRTGLPRSTVYDGLRRKKLPGRDLTLALVLALDGDLAGWQTRWTSLRCRLDAPVQPVQPVQPVHAVPELPNWLRRRHRWVSAAGVVVVAAAASTATAFLVGPASGCLTTTLYRVTASGNVIDAASRHVTTVPSGELFVVGEQATGPFRSRWLGTIESTGERGYVEQAKLDRLRETCS